jgi:2-polyprenyl-3-methyl-5-hydroxy-6-metoxy-1,4-benzoquinol methylase
MPGTEHFDQAAATWDLAERRVALAHAVVEAIATRVPLSTELTVLDFGCGTGLVTLDLGPRVGSITGADTSLGMLKTLEGKAKAQGTPVRLISLDTEESDELGDPYGLIVSSMTLHHIADVSALFHQFVQHLRPGGQIALADLDEEDGSFHDPAVSIHHRGFSRIQIQTWLKSAGFQEIHLETATVTHKGGKDYPVFLATARRDSRTGHPVTRFPIAGETTGLGSGVGGESTGSGLIVDSSNCLLEY